MKEEFARALGIARAKVKEFGDGAGVEYAIVEDATEQVKGGWLFHYNSSKFLISEDPYDALVGNGPIFVSDSGRVLLLPSAEWMDALAKFQAGLTGRP